MTAVQIMNELERLRAKLENRFAVTPAMLHSINMEGRLISVSDAWLDKLGYDRSEVIGRPIADFMTAESRVRAQTIYLPEFFRKGRSHNTEYNFVCKNGDVIDILLSGVVERDESGQPVNSIAVITDVTHLKYMEKQLAVSESKYRGLVEDQSEFVCLTTVEGTLSFVNNSFAKLYDSTASELIGKSAFDFAPIEQRARIVAHFEKVLKSGTPIENTNQLVLPDGSIRWMSWINRPLFDADGTAIGIHSVGRDVDRHVLAEQRLQESEARYRLLADNSTDMVFQLDINLARVYASPACHELLGYKPQEMIGVKPVSMVHPEDSDKVSAAFRSLIEGQLERHSIVNRIQHKDGRWIWVDAQFRTLRHPQTGVPTGIIGALRDISARKIVEEKLADAMEKLATLAREDGLTGLANRRTFDNAFAAEFERAKRHHKNLSLIMIDVDRFKSYNDLYGHPSGDECLRQVSFAMSATVYRPGDMIARFGGEEFVVLLPDTDEKGAVVIAERIRLAVLSMNIEHAASDISIITVSLGVASLSPDFVMFGQKRLLDDADRALYQAKTEGRNNVSCASSCIYLTQNIIDTMFVVKTPQ